MRFVIELDVLDDDLQHKKPEEVADIIADSLFGGLEEEGIPIDSLHISVEEEE